MSYTEPFEKLSQETVDLTRAINSLIEELQAIEWYQQRIDASQNDELKRLLAHNRDEEKEHAAMLLEWIRRRDGQMDRVLKEYLFTKEDLLSLEDR